MLKGEFEYLIGKEVTDEEYGVIEKVYTYHPSIKLHTGLKQIADIYKAGGMSTIRNMEETADIMIEMYNELEEARANVNKVIDRIQKFKEGNFQYEMCRRAIKEVMRVSNNDVRYFMEALLKRRFGDSMVNDVLKSFDK